MLAETLEATNIDYAEILEARREPFRLRDDLKVKTRHEAVKLHQSGGRRPPLPRRQHGHA